MNAIEYLFGNQKAKEFAIVLKRNGLFCNEKDFLKKSFFQGACIALFFSIIAFWNESSLAVVFFFIGFLLPFGLNYFLQYYFFEARKKKLEDSLPGLLLQLAGLPKKISVEKMIELLSESKNKIIAEEFSAARNCIENGASIEQALNELKERNLSKRFSKAIELLKKSYFCGADMRNAFSGAANNLMEKDFIFREQAAAMTIQKMTLVLAACLIVPMILGLTVGLVKGTDFNGMDFLDSTSAEERAGMLSAVLQGNRIYLLEFCLIAAWFLAFQQNDKKRFLVYALAMTPVSLIVYLAAQGF